MEDSSDRFAYKWQGIKFNKNDGMWKLGCSPDRTITEWIASPLGRQKGNLVPNVATENDPRPDSSLSSLTSSTVNWATLQPYLNDKEREAKEIISQPFRTYPIIKPSIKTAQQPVYGSYLKSSGLLQAGVPSNKTGYNEGPMPCNYDRKVDDAFNYYSTSTPLDFNYQRSNFDDSAYSSNLCPEYSQLNSAAPTSLSASDYYQPFNSANQRTQQKQQPAQYTQYPNTANNEQQRQQQLFYQNYGAPISHQGTSPQSKYESSSPFYPMNVSKKEADIAGLESGRSANINFPSGRGEMRSAALPNPTSTGINLETVWNVGVNEDGSTNF